MAFDLMRKKTCSSTAIAYIIFLLVFILLIHFSSIQMLDSQNRFTVREDHHHQKNLITVTDPDLYPQEERITCDRSHFRYDLCKINGLAVLDSTNATIYSIGPSRPIISLKPYPRKWEKSVMEQIREVKIKSGSIGPKCDVQHSSPAIVFSVGGYTGNFFHDVGDGFLPLFITLNSLSLVDRDVILVVDKAREWWIRKYADVIYGFSKHPIINLENDTSIHCFKWASVGLVSHGFMALDAKVLSGPLTLAHFHSFFRNVYSREGQLQHSPNPKQHKSIPKLVWLVRAVSIGRAIVNQDEARAIAEKAGFDVIMHEPTESKPLGDAYELINTSHAMIGVHGAALTHLLLLRPGSVMVQVMPLGLEWAGEVCYGQPAKDVGLEYMLYKVGLNESTLSKRYNKENPILKDPDSLLKKKGWDREVINVYLKEQNVILDLFRFRKYMENVYKKARLFMDMHG